MGLTALSYIWDIGDPPAAAPGLPMGQRGRGHVAGGQPMTPVEFAEPLAPGVLRSSVKHQLSILFFEISAPQGPPREGIRTLDLPWSSPRAPLALQPMMPGPLWPPRDAPRRPPKRRFLHLDATLLHSTLLQGKYALLPMLTNIPHSGVF